MFARLSTLLLVAALFLGAMPSQVHGAPIFTVGPGGGNPAENLLFNNANLQLGPATLIQGVTNNSNRVLDITSNVNLVGNGGQARIEGQGGAERLFRFLRAAELAGLLAQGRLEMPEHEAVVGLAQAGQPGLDLVRLPPAPLVLLQLLQADEGVDRMRWLARGANALTDAMLGADGDAQTAALSAAAESYGPALGLEPRDIVACAQAARGRVAQMAQALGLHVAPDAPARRLLQVTEAGPVVGDPTVVPTQSAQAQLAQGLERVRAAVAQKSMRLNEVLNLVLETVQRSLDMRCVVFCLREPKSGQLVGRLTLGSAAPDAGAAFRISPGAGGATDLFSAICAKGADLLISDTKAVATRLPAWYRQKVNAGTFLLLPLMLKGAPIGLIYADKAAAGAIVLKDEELALLRGLRDQALAAFAKGAP